MNVTRVVTLFIAAAIVAFVSGRWAGTDRTFVALDETQPSFGSGYYPRVFFDEAYDQANGSPIPEATSAIVAHHLLVAPDIAEVFKTLASDTVQTVILVSPNHFSTGMSRAQISKGSWNTVYGSVSADPAAVEGLLERVPFLKNEEDAYVEEHGIYNLMPFIAKSFPNAQVIPIILREELSSENAWSLGATLADAFPNAVLVASVDMTHYQPADITATNDARVLNLIKNAGFCNGAPCTDVLDIDSNASLRALFGWNDARGTTNWRLTHHGSSLAMGAAIDWHDNTSHILGYFLPK